jgi:hypothetical protein
MLSVQCLLLKSRNEPLGGAGTGFFGVVASQIIFESPFSIGDMVIAKRKSATKANAKINNMANETRNASTITGIPAPAKTSIVYTTFDYTQKILKMKVMILAW